MIQVPKRIDGEFVEKLLEWASNNKVNDVVIESDSPLWAKRLGVMEQLSERNISQAEVREVLQSFYQQSGPDTLVTGEYIKFPFEVLAKDETSYRYRVTATGVQGERNDRGIEIIFRPFPDEAPPPAQLSLPADFVQAFNSSYGVIYVTGPTGSGKSTSFASVLTERIKNKSERIVTEIMEEYGIAYESVGSSRYARGMLRHVRTYEPAALIDKLICGAYIEARSCERFAVLAPHVDKRLNDFYVSLLRSEARHYQDYLTLAESIATSTSGEDITERVAFFGEVEADLISSSDDDFKFHSGVPV